MVELRMLGPVELTSGDGVLDLGPQRRTVLAALAVDAGQPVALDTLIDRVWDDAPPGARRAVYAHVAHLRRVLAELDQAVAGQVQQVRLARRSGGYVLHIDPSRVDVHRSRALVRQAGDRAQPDTRRAAVLHEALSLSRGVPLSGLSGGWAARTRAPGAAPLRGRPRAAGRGARRRARGGAARPPPGHPA